MKRLCLLCMLLITRLATAQDSTLRIDHDPVFNLVLARQISYPLKAEAGAYAKIYAGFSIDKKGRIQQIIILNPAKIGYGFEEEVTTGLKRMPVMNPRYEGSYVLPVNFVYINYSDHDKQVSSSGTLPEWYFANRTLLSEIKRENNKPFRQRSSRYMRYNDLKYPNGLNN